MFMQERLQKYMAECGVSSRRKCEEIILQGRVKVNNALVKELGVKIDRDIDKVCVDNKLISAEENKIYIALNKPTGYLSTVEDDRGRKTILDLVKVNYT
jgi:23S rRNA pseudouridine2605 synthase